MNDGIHDNIPMSVYQADQFGPTPSLGRGSIVTLATRTPRHCYIQHPRLNQNYRERPDDGKFDMGTAVHSLLLEGIEKAEIIDADDWRTKAAKEARDAARAAGRIPLLPKQHAATLNMVQAALDYIGTTSLRGVFGRGKAEQTLLWTDAQGIRCKARPDLMEPGLILDYKSTEAEGPQQFIERLMPAHGYDVQAMHYGDGIEVLTGKRPTFLFLVQEVQLPHLCYLVECAESMADVARHKITRAKRLWRDCLKAGKWPGYSVEVHQAEATSWAMRNEEAAQ